MPNPSATAAAARSTLYQNFPDLEPVREALEPGVNVLEYARGEVLFARGERVSHIFFLLRGSVQEAGLRRLPNRTMQPRLVRTVTPSGRRPLPVLGLYEYLESQRHQTHALVDDSAQVLTIDAATFEKILYLRPELPAALAPLAILNRLRTIPFFSRTDRNELAYIADAVEPRHVPAGEAVYAWLNPDFYVIDRGQVAVTQSTGARTWLGNGAAFGIPSVDESAHALTDTDLLRIDRRVLADLAPFDYPRWVEHVRSQLAATLSQLYLFSDPAFTTERIAQLSGHVSHYFIPKRMVLTQQSAPSDSMWVLMPGSQAQLHGLDNAGEALTTTPAQGPNYFGEAALFAQTPADSTLEAEPNSYWLRLHRTDFESFLRLENYRLWDKLKLRGDVKLFIGNQAARAHYPWLQDGEGVVWPSRRHWIVLLRKTWLALTLLTAALMSFTGLAIIPGVQILAGLGLGVVGAIAFLFFLWGFYDFWNDYIVVTNRRIVRQEHVLLQTHRRQETGLEQVRNVDMNRSFLGQLLGYGLLEIQTAGAREGTIAFDYVPDVEEMQRAIRRQVELRSRHRAVAGKDDIQRHLEGRLGLRLVLPERVLHTKALPPAEQPTAANRTWLTQISDWLRKPTVEEEERIVWHKHWAVLVIRLFAPLLALLGLIALLFGTLVFSVTWLGALATAPVSFVILLAIIANLGVMAWRIADWRNDTYEVTDDEIADVEKKPLFFDEQRRTARLVDIVDILADIPGPMHYLLNFGNVRLETAATMGEFTFDSVPNPSRVVAEVRRRIEAARQREEAARAQQRARELADWFELYNRIRPNEPAA